MNTREKEDGQKYIHNLQTLCNEMGSISYTTINKFEALKQIVNQLKQSIPTKLYPKVYKEHGVDFTALGETTDEVSLGVKKQLYHIVEEVEAFREKKLTELKRRILTLKEGYPVDKVRLQEIESAIKHSASHGTTEQMLNAFHEQAHQLALLENPDLAKQFKFSVHVEETLLPPDARAKPVEQPLDDQDQDKNQGSKEHPEQGEEEEKEHKVERQQDDHTGLNDDDLDELYKKLTASLKHLKRTS